MPTLIYQDNTVAVTALIRGSEVDGCLMLWTKGFKKTVSLL